MKALLIVAIILIAAPHSLAQQNTGSRRVFPRGNWILSFGPSQTPGTVVDLYTVGSNASSKDVKVTDVWLQNRSNQDVAALKIAWKLFEKSNPSKTLLSGETPQFLGVALAPGERRLVNYPVVSFARIHGRLVRGGKLEGHFTIELWVTEVQFDNGNLEAESSSNPNLRNAAWKVRPRGKFLKVTSKPAPQDDEDFGCPSQQCGWSDVQQCYTCFDTKGSSCSWFNCSYCKSGRCRTLIE